MACMKLLFTAYDIQTLFYHSSGHYKTKPDGLDVSGMNKLFGGTQHIMRSAEMKDNTYVVPFSNSNALNVRDA